MSSSLFLVLASFQLCRRVAADSSFNEIGFIGIRTKIEADVLELAAEVERLYSLRCLNSTLSSCEKSNYDECNTAYPEPQCLSGIDHHIECREKGSGCGSLVDFFVSGFRIPAAASDGDNGNPTDPSVIESICFTRRLDEYFRDKRNQDLQYWQDRGVDPPSMHFGSYTGAFRIYPIRPDDQCGRYDPRLRPWYVAGSSGPKNVVLILDTSESMRERQKLTLAIEAAQRVVSTLSVSDRVAVVAFSDSARALTDEQGLMFDVTDENRKTMNTLIGNLTAGGGTNFSAAFEKAFEVLDRSVAAERTVSCNTAILFLTDGANTVGPNATEVASLVQSRTASVSARLKRPVLLFTYSVGPDGGDVHTLPSKLACSVEHGVWSKITKPEKIVDSLSSYYSLFALGLGSDLNGNFISWVEPYPLFVLKELGTTVSAPVYDRSKTPHLFLGVVGINLLLKVLDEALGGEAQPSVRSETIRRVVQFSQGSCPTELELSPCEIQSWRNASLPNGEGLCPNVANCTQLFQVVEEPCLAQGTFAYPRDLYENRIVTNRSITDRRCCTIGSESSLEQCPSPSSDQWSTGLVVGVACGGFGGLVVMLVVIWKIGTFVSQECREENSSGQPHKEPAAEDVHSQRARGAEPPAEDPFMQRVREENEEKFVEQAPE